MLKRCTGKLVEELKGQDPKHTQARVKYMREFLLPRCYVWVAIILVLLGGASLEAKILQAFSSTYSRQSILGSWSYPGGGAC